MTNASIQIPIEIIATVKTWGDLAEALGYGRKNQRKITAIQQAVVEQYPDSTLAQRFRHSLERTVSDEKFKEIVGQSLSVAGVLRACGLVPSGASYTTFYRRVKRLGLSTAHFKGCLISKGSRTGYKKSLEELLVRGSLISSSKLKTRLFDEGVKERRCEECGLEEWRGEPAPLELDHVNGINDDNRLTNLRILCPNCHAQTPTYRGKNKHKTLDR